MNDTDVEESEFDDMLIWLISWTKNIPEIGDKMESNNSYQEDSDGIILTLEKDCYFVCYRDIFTLYYINIYAVLLFYQLLTKANYWVLLFF